MFLEESSVRYKLENRQREDRSEAWSCDKESTRKGAEAKADSTKVTAPEAASTKPCSQRLAAKQGEEGDAKSAAVTSSPARERPLFRFKDPAKVKYVENQRATRLLRNQNLLGKTNPTRSS